MFSIADGASVVMFQAASTSSVCLSTSFFLRLISAVLTKILRAQPSKDPSPEKLSSLVNNVTKPSWRISSAASLSPMYRRQTANIFPERRS